MNMDNKSEFLYRKYAEILMNYLNGISEIVTHISCPTMNYDLAETWQILLTKIFKVKFTAKFNKLRNFDSKYLLFFFTPKSGWS
jgi:hypothetical protein